MGHRCDECETEFETLSRLRLHECSDEQGVDRRGAPTTETTADASGTPLKGDGFDRQELEAKFPAVVGDLPERVDDAREGDQPSLYRALAEYERVLATVARGDAPGGTDLLHDLRFAYYEPLADALDAAAETSGWAVLIECVDAYDPHEESSFPEVGHVIANAIGRWVIRTRRADGVEAIPPEALAFLGAIPDSVDEFHVAFEESYTYGWGIGHPEAAVGDRLHALAEDEPKFVKIALNTAFYVDQHAALDAFERIVTDETIDGTRSMLGLETDLTEFYFRAVADLQTPDLLGPHAPPYWEEDDNLPRVVAVDTDVKERIRELAHETGVADGLPAEWSLRDLDQSLLTQLGE